MKSIVAIALGVLAVSTSVFAQTPAEIDAALLAAPANLREGATVIKWKSDFTYETLRKGTNRLVCMDRSGQPAQQPVMIECTSIANMDRLAQNMKFEAEPDRAKRQAAPIDANALDTSPTIEASGCAAGSTTRAYRVAAPFAVAGISAARC